MIVQAKEDEELCDSRRERERRGKMLGYILQTESLRFADGLDMKCEKGRLKDDSRFLLVGPEVLF